MTQLLEYERINALRIVGDHATHRRTLEVEVRPKVMAHRRLAQAAAAAAATTESNDDHNDDTDKDEAHDLFERYCFTVRRENVLYWLVDSLKIFFCLFRSIEFSLLMLKRDVNFGMFFTKFVQIIIKKVLQQITYELFEK